MKLNSCCCNHSWIVDRRVRHCHYDNRPRCSVCRIRWPLVAMPQWVRSLTRSRSRCRAMVGLDTVLRISPTLPGQFNTIFSSLALYADNDAIPFNAGETTLTSVAVNGGSASLTWGSSPAGNYILTVAGATNGTQGGIYNGALTVSAVPEPETYAMMLRVWAHWASWRAGARAEPTQGA